MHFRSPLIQLGKIKMRQWAEEYKKKLIEPAHLSEIVQSLKSNGCSIATLNGSFDLLHAGHLHLIYSASQLADLLIVALNSDLSIQSYKSKKRPIIPLEYRLQLIAALQFVDYATYFDEITPNDLLAKIQPDIHVNGAEYGENCIEAETVKKYGGKIQLIKRINGLSTTDIITKISEITIDASDTYIQK